MQKKEFIRQLNELVPRPDPVTTEALYRFDRECAESEYIDMLTALRVVARNFSGKPSRAPMSSSSTRTPPCPARCLPPPSTSRPGAPRRRCHSWR